MSKNVQLLCIDVQKDFCDPSGSLFVPGADEDVKRLVSMIDRVANKLDDIHVTLDSHFERDIAHACTWIDSAGNFPSPFTIISTEDVENGTWSPANPGWRDKVLSYVKALESNGRFPLCIWPAHCIIGSLGQSLVPDFSDAVRRWEVRETAWANYVTKGSNPWTEHYSAVQADVPDPSDPSTQLNQGLIEILQEADVIGIAGQALSHCVNNTIRDVANIFGDKNVKKFILLEDCCSNVPGFEHLGEEFVKDMTALGMQVTTSDKFLTSTLTGSIVC